MRHQAQGLVVFALGLTVTGTTLFALHALAPSAGRLVELAVLTAANVVATALRFVLYRGWVFGSRIPRATTPRPELSPTPELPR